LFRRLNLYLTLRFTVCERSDSSLCGNVNRDYNLNPIHFELFQHAFSGVSFSTIFCHVPASGPLKLEHLGICDIKSLYSDLRAIIPHIRSLTSIDIGALRCSMLITLLLSERISPSMIQIARITQAVIDYLSDHPGQAYRSFYPPELFILQGEDTEDYGSAFRKPDVFRH